MSDDCGRTGARPLVPFAAAFAFAVVFVFRSAPAAGAAPRETAPREQVVSIRGKEQTLHVYGVPLAGAAPAAGTPPQLALVASGDLGWNGFSVNVAESLAAAGWRVAGFNVRAYLASFTAKESKLAAADVPGDYRVLLDLLAPDAKTKVLLLGVSEGAGLSVLAACDPALRERVRGVVGFGIPDENELGWKWADVLMYVTKRPPKEPSFRVSSFLAQLGAVPLASIFSTHDEYTPLAEEKALLDLAPGPKRLWMVESANHRFSDNHAGALAAMNEALAWIDAQAGSPRPLPPSAPTPVPSSSAVPSPSPAR